MNNGGRGRGGSGVKNKLTINYLFSVLRFFYLKVRCMMYDVGCTMYYRYWHTSLYLLTLYILHFVSLLHSAETYILICILIQSLVFSFIGAPSYSLAY